MFVVVLKRACTTMLWHGPFRHVIDVLNTHVTSRCYHFCSSHSFILLSSLLFRSIRSLSPHKKEDFSPQIQSGY